MKKKNENKKQACACENLGHTKTGYEIKVILLFDGTTHMGFSD